MFTTPSQVSITIYTLPSSTSLFCFVLLKKKYSDYFSLQKHSSRDKYLKRKVSPTSATVTTNIGCSCCPGPSEHPSSACFSAGACGYVPLTAGHYLSLHTRPAHRLHLRRCCVAHVLRDSAAGNILEVMFVSLVISLGQILGILRLKGLRVYIYNITSINKSEMKFVPLEVSFWCWGF